MPFGDPVRREARRRAHYCCCFCANPFVEAHHIIPQKENGPDTLENAAPLCANCHALFGGNPDLRKQIRERRDFWWALCAKDPNKPQAVLNERLTELWDRLPKDADQKAQAEFLEQARKVSAAFFHEVAVKLEDATAEKDFTKITGIPLPAPWGLPMNATCPQCGGPASFVGVNPALPWANVSYRCEKHGAFYPARIDSFDD